ncbi:MAG: response regulator transcription factor [Bacteroidota bacterium]
MNEITAVIIDDEQFNRELIKSFVAHTNPAFIITGEAASVAEGYKLINATKPDLVFLDIKMTDGTGFDLLNLFDRIAFEVVFITGFDEYALKAFDYHALDYILKPVELAKFTETLKKVQARVLSQIHYDKIKKIVETYNPGEAIIAKIPVHYNDKVVLLDLREIVQVSAHEGCTCFYKSQNEKYTSAKQLSDFAFILESFPSFIRITKGVFININFITSYSKGQDCTVTMNDGSTHEISRRKKTQVLEAIQFSKNK